MYEKFVEHMGKRQYIKALSLAIQEPALPLTFEDYLTLRANLHKEKADVLDRVFWFNSF